MSDQLSHRDRFIKALNHQETDRVPIAFGGPECSIHRLAHNKLLDYLDYREDKPAPIIDCMLQVVEPDERLHSKFGVDVRWLTPNESPMEYDPKREIHIDEMMRIFRFAGGFFNQVDYPLRSGTKSIRFPKCFGYFEDC